MNNIETMKLALEALETNNKAWKSLADSGDAGWWEAEEQPFYEISVKAITALRQAIEQAQKAKPLGASEETQRFAIQVEKLLCEKLGRNWSPSGISIQTLVDELADRQTQQATPMAWPKTPSDISNMIGSSFVWREHKISDVKPHKEDKYCVTAHDLLESFEHWNEYTFPSPRQPLTDEEIAELWLDIQVNTPASGVHEEGLQPWRFARAIEAAHGIKGEA